MTLAFISNRMSNCTVRAYLMTVVPPEIKLHGLIQSGHYNELRAHDTKRSQAENGNRSLLSWWERSSLSSIFNFYPIDYQ